MLLTLAAGASANPDYCIWTDTDANPPAGVNPENCGPQSLPDRLVDIDEPGSPAPPQDLWREMLP